MGALHGRARRQNERQGDDASPSQRSCANRKIQLDYRYQYKALAVLKCHCKVWRGHEAASTPKGAAALGDAGEESASNAALALQLLHTATVFNASSKAVRVPRMAAVTTR